MLITNEKLFLFHEIPYLYKLCISAYILELKLVDENYLIDTKIN